MINYQTANLKDLFNELEKTSKFLSESLIRFEKTYKETGGNILTRSKPLFDKLEQKLKTKERKEIENQIKNNKTELEYLRYYYKSHSVNKITTNSQDVIKVIDNLLTEPVVREQYIKQLKSIGEDNRINGLDDFRKDWSRTFKNNNYEPLYTQSRVIDEWITECRTIASELENFIGDKNPLIKEISSQQSKIDGIKMNTELIELKTLGVKIIGDKIAKGSLSPKSVFNKKEEDLIYFLYYRFLKNKDECFLLPVIAKELDISVGYLKNCITSIHRTITETMLLPGRPVRLEKFIKNEPNRGYHLNPRLFV